MTIRKRDFLDAILMAGRSQCDKPSPIERIVRITQETIGVSDHHYLAWNERYSGPTGYIDGIELNDLCTQPLMWGIDSQDRLFVTFQRLSLSLTTLPSLGQRTEKIGVATLFQRYPNRSDSIAQGGLKLYPIEGLKDEDERELREIFSGKMVVEKRGKPIST